MIGKKKLMPFSLIVLMMILSMSLTACGGSSDGSASSTDIDLSGTVEWKTQYGVYNPETKSVEWKYNEYGAYNSGTKSVEWKFNQYGVYNPETKSVEWKYNEYGAYNPGTKSVEWKYNQYGVYIPNNPEDYNNYLISIGIY